MFDLNNIEFIGGKYGRPDVDRDLVHYSFVGIQRDPETQQLQFWLPVGFQEFDNKDYELVKRFFFRMYRTFKQYISNNEHEFEDADLDNQRDGLVERDDGFTFHRYNQEDAVFYTKLNALDSILEGYDDMRIAALLQKQKKSADLDYSQLHKHLHQAIFLEDHVAYVDEMVLSKDVITLNSPPILQLFCYIYIEIKKELEEFDSISDIAKELCEDFIETYLHQASSLFDQDYFKETVRTLKETLDEIDQQTAYKDEDYWHFYDAIEAFLYGENDFSETTGVYWGLTGFSRIWEEMCQNYVLNYNRSLKGKVLFAERGRFLENYKKLAPNPFCLTMQNAQEPRYLRPDLVYFFSEQAQRTYSYDEVFQDREINRNFYEIKLLRQEPELVDLYHTFWNELLRPRIVHLDSFEHSDRVKFGRFDRVKAQIEKELQFFQNRSTEGLIIKVVDYKYMGKASFDTYTWGSIDSSGHNKIGEDIQKQLIYEWTLQQNIPKLSPRELNKIRPISKDNFKTESEFWIPWFSTNQDFEESKEYFSIVSEDFKQSRIKVVGINFNIVQKMYIQG